MKLIVGLGNPGKQYANTRHNVGFLALEQLAERLGTRIGTRAWQGLHGRGRLAGQELVLLAPQTYMNLSGQSVSRAMADLGVGVDDLIVIYDDAHLDVGRLRLRAKGSGGGHKGVSSIIGSIGGNVFARVRVGIGGAQREDLIDHVLLPFSRGELPRVREAITLACDAALDIAEHGIDWAMNRYNQRAEGADA